MIRVDEDDYKGLLNEDYYGNNMSSISRAAISRNLSELNSSELSDNRECISEKKKKSNLDRKRQDYSITDEYGNDQISHKKMGKWTDEEDEILNQLVITYGAKNWKKIAEKMRNRTPIQCLHRWTKILQPGLIKGPWSMMEDKKLVDWVQREGPVKWSKCAEFILGRNGKQCRERWFNSLNPYVKKGNWTIEEDYKIFFYYKKYGGKWSKTVIYFPGRTENSIKNRFYSTLRRVYSEKKREDYQEKSESQHIENKNESLSFSLYGLDELKKFISIAEELIKIDFMRKNNYSIADLIKYEENLHEIAHLQPQIANSSLISDKCKIDQTPIPIQTNQTELNSKLIEKTIKSNKPVDKKEKTPNQNANQTPQVNNNNVFNLNLNYNNNSQNNNNFTNPTSFDYQFNSNMDYNFYRNMDIGSLEQNINDMCESSLFLPELNGFNLDSHIDNLLENIFNTNNIVVSNDPLSDCNLCTVAPEKKIGNFEKNAESCLFPSVENNFKKITESISNKFNHVKEQFKAPVLCEAEVKKNDQKLKSEGKKYNNEVLKNLLSQLNGLENMVKKAKKELSNYEMKDYTGYIEN